MLHSARNTLASIEESADRLSKLAELRPELEEIARDVHRTCVEVQAAARAHRRAADVAAWGLETLAWGIIGGLCVWYVYENARDVVRIVRGLGS